MPARDIVGSLMRVIKREKTDMVVISTHGMSGWHPLIFGSIAEQVIKQVNCTLLLLQSDQRVSAAEEPAIEVWEDSCVPVVAVAGHLGSPVSKSRTSSQQRLDRAANDLLNEVGTPNSSTTKIIPSSQTRFGRRMARQKLFSIITLCVDVGGVLLTNGWNHLERKRAVSLPKLLGARSDSLPKGVRVTHNTSPVSSAKMALDGRAAWCCTVS